MQEEQLMCARQFLCEMNHCTNVWEWLMSLEARKQEGSGNLKTAGREREGNSRADCCNYTQVFLSRLPKHHLHMRTHRHTHTLHATGLLGEACVQKGSPNLRAEQTLNEDRKRRGCFCGWDVSAFLFFGSGGGGGGGAILHLTLQYYCIKVN